MLTSQMEFYSRRVMQLPSIARDLAHGLTPVAVGLENLLRAVIIHVASHAQIPVQFHCNAQNTPPAISGECVWNLYIAEILEMNDVAIVRGVENFSLRNRILRP